MFAAVTSLIFLNSNPAKFFQRQENTYDNNVEEGMEHEVLRECNRLVSTSSDTFMKIWDLESYECLATVCHGGVASTVRLVDRFRFLTAVGKVIRVWDSHHHLFATTRERKQRIGSASASKSPSLSSTHPACMAMGITERSGQVQYVGALPDGRIVVCIDDAMEIWETHSLQCVNTLQVINEVFWCVASMEIFHNVSDLPSTPSTPSSDEVI